MAGMFLPAILAFTRPNWEASSGVEYLRPARYADLELLARTGHKDPVRAFFLDFRGDIDPAPFSRLRGAFREELLKGSSSRLLAVRAASSPLPEAFLLVSFFDGIEGDCFLKALPCVENLETKALLGGLRELLSYIFLSRNRHRAMVQFLGCEERLLGLFEKLGFIQEGRRREEAYARGRFYDIIPLSMTQSRFLAQNS